MRNPKDTISTLLLKRGYCSSLSLDVSVKIVFSHFVHDIFTHGGKNDQSSVLYLNIYGKLVLTYMLML